MVFQSVGHAPLMRILPAHAHHPLRLRRRDPPRRPIGDASARKIEGDLFGEHEVTGTVLAVEKLLAPLVPADILCIGLNYREHAAESNSAIPTNPVLFIKGGNALNNPATRFRSRGAAR
jgi:2-keto-4-pentenoate hydratase/2-oxohepta-3-ene-1,7-dioic acid hydratase in catechol pathway